MYALTMNMYQMNTYLMELPGVGPITHKVFLHAGFSKVGELYPHSDQEQAVRSSAETLAIEGGSQASGHWRALATRCCTIIKCVRNPQFSEVLPEVFMCPITYEAFEDPVITPQGLTYERSAIERSLREGLVTPGDPEALLDHTHLIPNRAMKDAVVYYNESCSHRRFGIPYRLR